MSTVSLANRSQCKGSLPPNILPTFILYLTLKLYLVQVIDIAKSYHAEVKWRDEHYIPTSVEEHLQISVRSSACMQIISFVFISLGDVTTREVLEWALTYPKIIRSVCIVGRIGNDMVSHEVGTLR